jgi:hypothetical protein
MEVTDLKELKKLMKGEASNKFEFIEDVGDHIGSYNKNMMFSYQSNTFGNNKGATYNTYNTGQIAASAG